MRISTVDIHASALVVDVQAMQQTPHPRWAAHTQPGFRDLEQMSQRPAATVNVIEMRIATDLMQEPHGRVLAIGFRRGKKLACVPVQGERASQRNLPVESV